MCEYCDPERVRPLADHMAEELRRLADKYGQISSGRIKPHTDEMQSISSLATAVVRNLVQEWV